ncbi:MAG: CoA-binding protein [Thermoplasmata archaeon]|nr:CoA-binding protein [Thermoplasmata archaeon]MCI4356173.1 CoA-binding protein [Thermoplasmata archaeon]
MDPDDARVRDILTRAETIAVVGLSDKPERDSNEVARYLQSVGYRIVPVNPVLTEVLGERAYPSLSAVPADVRVDIADVFRRPDQVVPVVQEAIERRVPTIWLQLGVANAEAAAKAGASGSVAYFENRCIMVEHRRLKVPPKRRPA